MPPVRITALILAVIVLAAVTVAAGVQFGGMSIIPALSIVAMIAALVVVRWR